MRLLDYMKREGLRATASKALGKIDAKRGGKAAETVFLRRDNHGLPSLPIPAGLQIRTIEALDIPEFERFNFFPHINPNAYVPAKEMAPSAALTKTSWSVTYATRARRGRPFTAQEISFSRMAKRGSIHATSIGHTEEEASIGFWSLKQRKLSNAEESPGYLHQSTAQTHLLWRVFKRWVFVSSLVIPKNTASS